MQSSVGCARDAGLQWFVSSANAASAEDRAAEINVFRACLANISVVVRRAGGRAGASARDIGRSALACLRPWERGKDERVLQSDMELVLGSFTRLLSTVHEAAVARLPNSYRGIECYQELFVLMWKLLDENEVRPAVRDRPGLQRTPLTRRDVRRAALPSLRCAEQPPVAADAGAHVPYLRTPPQSRCVRAWRSVGALAP
jgi:hypothetical protein